MTYRVDGDQPTLPALLDPVAPGSDEFEGALEVVDPFHLAERRFQRCLGIVYVFVSIVGLAIDLSLPEPFAASTPDRACAILAGGAVAGLAASAAMYWPPVANRVHRALDRLERRR